MHEAAERMLREHLPYELDMLEWAYAFLHDQKFEDQRKDEGQRNAAIECFWTHARNLYEFMTRKGKGDFEGVAAATDFVGGAFNPDLPFEKMDDNMNVQVSHLQYERPSSVNGKLGGYDMGRFREALNRAVKLFESKLNDDARGIWKMRQPVQYVYLHSAPLSSTNHTTSVSTGSIEQA